MTKRNKNTIFSLIVLFILSFLFPTRTLASEIEITYSHRVIPSGRTPDQDVVDHEGGIWATFRGKNPFSPTTHDTSLHQVSDTEFRHFFPWNWTTPYHVEFAFEDDDTVSLIAAPESVYPFDPEVHGVPVINLHTAPPNLWDPEFGIYVWGNNINFDQRGSGWERATTMDYYSPNGSLVFSEPVGLRISGQYSRYLDQKGLRIYFDDYGTSNSIEFDFFGSSPASFQRVVMRDNLTARDCIVSNLAESIFRNQGHLGSRYSLVHTYLNDEYWGMYSLRDRIDDNFFDHTLGLENTDYILLKDGDPEYGNAQLWYDFLDSFSQDHDFESHEWFEEVNSQIDLLA